MAFSSGSAWNSAPSTKRISQAGPKSAAGTGTCTPAARRRASPSGRARAGSSTHCPTLWHPASTWGSTGQAASGASFSRSRAPPVRATDKISFSLARVMAT